MREKLGHLFARIAARASAIQRNDALGAVAGFAMLALLLAGDIVLGEDVNLIGTLIVVPFVTALWAGTVVTALVALAALAAVAASGLWNMNFGAADYDARLIVLVLGGLLAVGSAWARERARLGARRLELLDDVGAIADGSLPLAQTLERVMQVIVPAFADFCMVDAIHSHRVMRSAVCVQGRPDGEDRRMEKHLAGREPSLPAWMVRPQAPFPRQPRFIPRFNDVDVQRLAHGPDDLEWLRGLGLRSSITVAMLARDRMLGALTLSTAWSGRRYSLHDVRFAQALASRVALALDNAGLFSDLESVERRMDNVMSILDEAVVIHDSDGELVFANPAAARLMGFDSAQEGGPGPTSTPTAAIRDRFVIRSEDGTTLPPELLVGRRALAGESTEPLVLRVSPREGGRERWLITRAKPILGPEGKALYSVTAIEDVTAVKRAEYAQRLLARAGELLATSSDPDALLSGLADLMTPEFSDSCIHVEPGVTPPPPGDDSRSVIVAPMNVGDQSFGALVFANGPEGREFDADDEALALELARRAAATLEVGRQAAERAEIARVLQEGLKPPALPHMPGWETAAIYLPAGELNAVGGDFYDAFEVADGWMVTVGDVVGRGAAAASLTALARHTIRTAGLLTGDPRRALELLDAELRDRGETALCTAAIMVLPREPEDPAGVTFVSAGHPLPLLLRDGEVEEVGTPGPLLGAFEGASWQPEKLMLEPGDQLVLFTDGVTEARGRQDRFGEGRLRAELAGAEGPLAAVRRITRALDGFLGGEADDDVAVVAVRRQVLPRLEPGAALRGPAAASRTAPSSA